MVPTPSVCTSQKRVIFRISFVNEVMVLHALYVMTRTGLCVLYRQAVFAGVQMV